MANKYKYNNSHITNNPELEEEVIKKLLEKFPALQAWKMTKNGSTWEIKNTQQNLTNKLGTPYFFDAGKEILFWDLCMYGSRYHNKRSHIRILDFIDDGLSVDRIAETLHKLSLRRYKPDFSFSTSPYSSEEELLLAETDTLSGKVFADYNLFIQPLAKVIQGDIELPNQFNTYYVVSDPFQEFEAKIITVDLPNLGYEKDVTYKFFIQVRRYISLGSYEYWYSISKYKYSEELGYPVFQSMEKLRPFISVRDSLSNFFLSNLMNNELEDILVIKDQDLVDEVIDSLI